MCGKFLLCTNIFFFIFQEGEDPENPNEAVEENCSVLSRTPSSRLLSRSRPSSFRTISLEPLSPVPSIRHQMPQRTKSFKRNRYVMYLTLLFTFRLIPILVSYVNVRKHSSFSSELWYKKISFVSATQSNGGLKLNFFS